VIAQVGTRIGDGRGLYVRWKTGADKNMINTGEMLQTRVHDVCNTVDKDYHSSYRLQFFGLTQ